MLHDISATAGFGKLGSDDRSVSRVAKPGLVSKLDDEPTLVVIRGATKGLVQ